MNNGKLNYSLFLQGLRNKTVAMALALSLSTLGTPIGAQSLGSDLADFWERSGGGVNVTKPSAYQGQRAGFATLGSVYLRTKPRSSNIASIQLPSIRAGCGGIDLFGGAFSFISAEELIAMAKAIMQNAAGFAFELALESLAPAVKEQMEGLRDLAAKINAMNINSCEAGMALTASLWPKTEAATSHICKSIGSYQGIFADGFQSRHGCSNKGQNAATNSRAENELKAQLPVDVNFAWKAIKENPLLNSNRRLAELFMTFTGTVIITAPPDDNEGAGVRTIAPRAMNPDMAKVLVEGGTYQALRCNDANKCLVVEDQNATLAVGDALFSTALSTIEAMEVAITADTAIPDSAIALINMTSIPVYETLITAKSYKYSFVQDDMYAIAELVAIDLAMNYIDEGIGEMLKAASNVDSLGSKSEEFGNSLRETRKTLQVFKSAAAERYNQAIRALERLKLAKIELAGAGGSKFKNLFKAE